MTRRFQVIPGDVPTRIVARRMGLLESEFVQYQPSLEARGFPKPDPTTGLYDIDAVDEWRRRRNPELFMISTEIARDGRAIVKDRLARLRGHG
jgi:hypothetical protein